MNARCVLVVVVTGVLLSMVSGMAWATSTNATAGVAVRSFRFGHLVAADALNERQLVVRVWPKQWWLLRVDDDCDLTRARSQFNLTSSLNNVNVNRDRVLFASDQLQGACRVRQIRPLTMEDAAASAS